MLKSLLLLALLPAAAQAVTIFAPTDTVYGVLKSGDDVLIGGVGGDGGNGVYTDNFWPGGEAPNFAIDGVGQKYLNFAELNTGIMVSPGSGSQSIVTTLQVWTANDATGRDPASYEVYGTNSALTGGNMVISDFTLISSGALSLPGVLDSENRTAGGATPLTDSNSFEVSFVNATAYTNYLVIFPTVKNEPGVNSMQIGEIQLYGDLVPEPGSALLAGLGLAMMARRRRNA